MTHLANCFHDIQRFVIWGDNPNEGDDGKRRPRMTLGFRDGNPRFTVYTGAQGADGMINFPCDFPHMAAIATYIKEMAEAPPGQEESKMFVGSLSTVYDNNMPTKNTKIVSTLQLGKSKEGIIYFVLLAENKPKIIFPLRPSKFHTFTDSQKSTISEAEVSKRMAKGMSTILLNILSSIMVDHSAEMYESGILKSTSTTTSNNGTPPPKGKSKTDLMDDLDDITL